MKPKYKENPADAAAGKWMDEQLELAPRRRLADRALLVSLALIIVVFGVLVFALPSDDFSEEENRALASFPELTLESLISGEFTAGISDFYADRFPGRNVFVGVKAFFEKLMLKQENNGIIEAEDGYIIERLEYTDYEYENIDENLKAINKFMAAMEKEGIDTVFAVAPRSVDVMTSKLPALYDTVRVDAVWERVFSSCPHALTFTDELESAANNGEYVWYKTDHHYTTLGAYYAYVALSETLGYTPYSIEYFVQESVSEDFLGTTYSSSGMKWSDKDTMIYFRFEGDERFTVSYPQSSYEALNGFYDRSYLTVKDKYSSFLGGNHSRTSVSLDGEERPTLMLIKDSFSHALAPFLALHFDLELVDLRYYTSSVTKLVNEIDPDKILVIYGIDTLASSTESKIIAMGVK